MSNFDLSGVVKNELAQSTSNAKYEKAVKFLQEVAKQLEAAVPNVTFIATPSYPTNIGRQWLVQAVMPNTDHKQTVFRAYIESDGLIRFDFYGEDLVECKTPRSAQKAVLDFFTRQTSIDMLRDIGQMANSY